MNNKKGIVFDIERYSLHNGRGIRTTIFLKGCLMCCLWCSNPESQHSYKELAYFSDKCNGCGHCITSCQYGAISREEVGCSIKVDFQKCTSCGMCTKTCYSEALVLLGKEMSSEEVVRIASRDLPFYLRSGGGVTLSGGEPLFQLEFSSEILRFCKTKGINTTIQTSGYAEKSDFDVILPYLDLIIFDIKHLDPKEHKKGTGLENKKIIRNLKYLNSVKSNLILQIALIPGYNDSEDHLEAVFSLARELESVQGVSLLAYHSLGVSKYKRLGRKYLLSDISTPSRDYLDKKKVWAKQFGVPLISF